MSETFTHKLTRHKKMIQLLNKFLGLFKTKKEEPVVPCESEPIINKEISLSEIYGEVVDEINLNIKDSHRIFTRVKPATCSFDGIKFTENPEEKMNFEFHSDVVGFRNERDCFWLFSEPPFYSVVFSKDEIIRFRAWEKWCKENGFDGIVFNTKEYVSMNDLIYKCIDVVRKRHEEKK